MSDPESQALQLIRDRKWLNYIYRQTGVPKKVIHKLAHDNGLTVAKAPPDAYGRNRYAKLPRVTVRPVWSPEDELRARKASLRWSEWW